MYVQYKFKSNVEIEALLSLDKGFKIQLIITFIADKGLKLT